MQRLRHTLLAALLASSASAADWLHYRGPAQNGSSTEAALFPAGGPRELWRVQLGIGLSSMTVAGDRVYSAGYKDGNEVLYCLDAKSGKETWTHSWPAKIGDNLFEGGPRATPTLDGKFVYMLGNEGAVFCLDAASGKVVWQKNLLTDLGGKRPEWGYCGAPTIDGDHVILDSGGPDASTVALNKTTGAVVWKSGSDIGGYAPAIIANIRGKKLALVFKGETFVGCDAVKGGQLWSFPFVTQYKVNAAAPLVVGDKVLISAGYNHGTALLNLASGKPEQVWFNNTFRAHFNSPVEFKGSAFGIDGTANPKAPLVCIDFATGEEKWRTKEVQGGSLILAADKLLILTETGDLVVANPEPKEYKELARKNVLTGRCWVQPTLANGTVYCRNNLGELVALQLTK